MFGPIYPGLSSTNLCDHYVRPLCIFTLFFTYRLLSPCICPSVVSDVSLFKEQPNNIVHMHALARIMNLLNFLVKLLDA